jgi:hypothetical protein
MIVCPAVSPPLSQLNAWIDLFRAGKSLLRILIKLPEGHSFSPLVKGLRPESRISAFRPPSRMAIRTTKARQGGYLDQVVMGTCGRISKASGPHEVVSLLLKRQLQLIANRVDPLEADNTGAVNCKTLPRPTPPLPTRNLQSTAKGRSPSNARIRAGSVRYSFALLDANGTRA